MLMRDDFRGFAKPPRLGCRVVLNNATISIYMSDNFGEIQFSSNLPDITVSDCNYLILDRDDENCFKI